MDIIKSLHGRNERSWQLQAKCMGVDPDRFYPEDDSEYSTPEEVAVTKQICGSCVVKSECLNYALVFDRKEGIWGGLTGEERQLLLEIFAASFAPQL